MLKVQSMINSETGDATLLAGIIKQDPALASAVLKTANSSFYNAINRRISSVPEAIARIGFNEVLRITLAMSVIEQFANTRSMIGYKAFWRHSLTAAGMTGIIADLSRNAQLKQYKQDLFLAGLLHDVGILIYDQFFHEEFTGIIEYAIKEEKTYLFSESAVSPKENHASIGGALLEIWNMPLQVIGAVRYHHAPNKCPEKFRDVVATLSLAEYVLCNGYLGSFEGEFSDMDQSVWEITGFTHDDVGPLYVKAEVEADKSNVMLSVGGRDHKTLLDADEVKYADKLQLRNI
jgi:HD-like signal output (HDOD) protein